MAENRLEAPKKATLLGFTIGYRKFIGSGFRGSRFRGSGFRVQGHWSLDTGRWSLEAYLWPMDPRYWKFEEAMALWPLEHLGGHGGPP